MSRYCAEPSVQFFTAPGLGLQSANCWVTIGRAQNGQVLVVVHTSAEVSATELHIRIISARRADPAEARDYEQTPR